MPCHERPLVIACVFLTLSVIFSLFGWRDAVRASRRESRLSPLLTALIWFYWLILAVYVAGVALHVAGVV